MSNSQKKAGDVVSLASEKAEEDEAVNSELETIFENGSKRTFSLSHPPEPKGNNHENPLFFDLLPQAVPEMSAGWLPGDQSLTSVGLPPGWTMQLMDNGKVLYVDNINGCHTWKDPRTGTAPRKRGPFFSSPPSPLSLMDVLTVGTGGIPPTSQRQSYREPVEKGGSVSSGSTEDGSREGSRDVAPPPEERLLPIGGAGEPKRAGGGRGGLSLLDRVWQVLGSIEDEEDRVPLVGREQGVSQHVRVAAVPSTEDVPEEPEQEVAGQPPPDQIGQQAGLTKAGQAPRQRKLGVCPQPPTDLWEKEEELEQVPSVSKQSQLRIGEETVIDRCATCGALTERYTHSEVALALVVVNTFVHRDPQLAAPLLPEILIVAARIAAQPLYSWEAEGSLTVIPGNPRSVARQFLRVTLQQLSSNGVFPLLFKIDLNEPQRKAFYSTIVSCLNDFSDLSPTVPVQLFFENIEAIKQGMEETLNTCLPNLICFLSFIQFDHITNWSAVFAPMETFFRNLSLITTSIDGKAEKLEPQGKDMKLSNIGPVMKLAAYAMKMMGANNHRSILDPIAKVIGFAIQFCTFEFQVDLSS